MQLLIPDIKDNFSAKITRISLAIVPEWNPSWKSSAPEDEGTYWNFHSSLLIFLMPLAPHGGLGCSQLRTQPWLCTSLLLFGLKPAGSWIRSFAWQPLAVPAKWCFIWVPVCQVSSDRSRHQGGRGGRVFVPWIEHLDSLQVTLPPLGASRI